MALRALLAAAAALDTLSSSRLVLYCDRDRFLFLPRLSRSLSRCSLLFLSFMCAEENFFFSLPFTWTDRVGD